MRTLHVCYSFPPDPPGGTEVYVDGLCRSLQAAGQVAIVAAPGDSEAAYEIDGLGVRRFGADPSADLEALYAGDRCAAASFARLLDAEAPDLVHLHALTPACSPLLVAEVKRRGLPLVFTLHTPTATCQRGTLLEGGTRVCDGRVDVQRCATCVLQALGAGALPSRVLASIPVESGHLLAKLGRHGGVWTALRMSSLIGVRLAGLERLLRDADRIVVLTPWVEDLLRVNGVPAERLVRSVHGVAASATRPTRRVPLAGPLRIAHLGRLDPAKGTSVLIRAMRAVPSIEIELDIYGVPQQSSTALPELIRLAAGDRRIRWHPPVPPSEVIGRLSGYDALAVPSQGLETGPLVVLEAFAAGIPVLGSALGGVADKVTDGVDGLLVRPFDSEDAWAAALARVATDRGLVSMLASGVRRPRSMDDVAGDMRAVYASLVDRLVSARAPLTPVAHSAPAVTGAPLA